MLILLIWVALVGSMTLLGQYASTQSVTTITIPDGMNKHKMDAWVEWIHEPRLRRQNNTRRHSLPRKKRRRYQLQLRRILKRQRRADLKRKRESKELKSTKERNVLAGIVIVLTVITLILLLGVV